mmetsp:Transcript_48090/g.117803  ORF Transcript_48090/g.117803 Transcript_48090/m.117803 type:complete len:311 (+) Transcript_48090:66-998(+)
MAPSPSLLPSAALAAALFVVALLAPHAARDMRIAGDDDGAYKVSDAERRHFLQHGYVVLRGVVRDAELPPLEAMFDRFTSRDSPSQGRDFCDMSGPFDRRYEDFKLVNAMLPRVYDAAAVAGNVFERRAASIARQLYGDDMQLDYDQLLGKRPQQAGAKFELHQDMSYWPRRSPDTRTATVSLAINDAPVRRGCLVVVPGSHRPPRLRKHTSIAAEVLNSTAAADRDAHAQRIEAYSSDYLLHLPLRRGDATVHNEWVVHGSGGNLDTEMRKTYVVAFRSAATVAYERKHNFTHSHNDEVNWERFDELGI